MLNWCNYSMNFFAHLSHHIWVQHGISLVQDPSDINTGVAEQPLASAGVSALLWGLGGDFWGNFVNDGGKAFQKAPSHPILTWEMGCAGTLGLLQLSSRFQLLQAMLLQTLWSQEPVKRTQCRDLSFNGICVIRKADKSMKSFNFLWYLGNTIPHLR